MNLNRLFSKFFKNSLSAILCLLLLGVAKTAVAQIQPSPPDTSKSKQVRVDFSDLFEYIVKGPDNYQKLTGNVELRQDSVYMYCDSAIIKNETQVTAMSRVLIQQGDSVSVFADSAFYDGALKFADLYGEVVLLNGAQKLFTDSLHYDLTTKIASYSEGATLSDDTTQLTSKRGYYFVDTKEVFFKDDVVVVSQDFSLKADTLKFNTETRLVYFLGPTLISTKENGKIYCESGFYDTRRGLAEFTTNAQYSKENQQAVADTIRYDGRSGDYILDGNARFTDEEKLATADQIRYNEAANKTFLTGNAHYIEGKQDIVADEIQYDGKTKAYSTKGRTKAVDGAQILQADQLDFDNERGVGVAVGNVVWQDTVQKTIIKADQAEYDKKRDYLKTKGSRPLMISVMDGDSLFLRCDTLVSQRRDTASSDSSRVLLAYRNVRIFKSNLQSICDSLVYSNKDSLFYFYKNPVIWSDTTQFTADTLAIRTKNNQLDRIFLYNNAFIINSPDEIFFNQIKGKYITAFFDKKELRRMLVEGNAESVYYVQDDKKGYIGVNKTICSEMLLHFGNNKVESITFYAQPKAKLSPMNQTDHNALKMDGFNWNAKSRPRSKYDL